MSVLGVAAAPSWRVGGVLRVRIRSGAAIREKPQMMPDTSWAYTKKCRMLSPLEWRPTMRYAIASLLMVAEATAALAEATKYYVVVDTVSNCAVVDSKPSASSGLKVIGDKGGYSSIDGANKALKGAPKGKCKGLVQ